MHKEDNYFMKFLNHIFNKHRVPAIAILSFLAILLLIRLFSTSFAVAPNYAPGETLDPAEGPGTAVVVIPTGVAIDDTVDSGTNGSVLFLGGTNQLKQDNSNLFWDDTNFRLGIGTTGPNFPLDVVSSGIDYMIPSFKAVSFFGVSGLSGKGIILGLNNADGSGVISPANERDLAFWTAPPGINTNSEKMRLTSDGKVGIGTTSPSSPLEIVRDQNALTSLLITNVNVGNKASAGIQFSNESGDVADFKTVSIANSNSQIAGSILLDSRSAYGLVFANENAVPIIFNIGGLTSTEEKMRITSGGNVGIGTASPMSILDLYKQDEINPTELNIRNLATYGTANLRIGSGGGRASILTFVNSQGDSTRARIFSDSPSGSPANDLNFETNGITAMRILSGGNVGIGTATPGSKLSIVGLPSSPVMTGGFGVGYGVICIDSAGNMFVDDDSIVDCL